MLQTGRQGIISAHASLPRLLRLLFLTALFFPLLLPTRPAGARKGQDDDDVVRIESDLVVLNVTVTDAQGKYVHKIPRGEFKVFEDGAEQKISTFAREENPFAAAVLLDTSGSMETRIMLARAAAITFLDRLRSDDVAAVYHFHTEVERLQDYSHGRDLPPVAYDLRSKGMTKLNDAVLQAAQDLARRPETRRAILLLSDGADTHSRASLDKALDAALAAGATVYTVNMADLNLPPNKRLAVASALRKYAEKSGGRYVDAPGGRALQDAFTDIVEELSNQYTVGYRPSKRARDGRWRAIEVKVARTAEHKVRTRSGYRAPKS